MAEPAAQSRSTGYVAMLRRLVEEQLTLKPSPAARGLGQPIDAQLAPVLLFSPHPDDESITGLLPLRLREEEGRRVINIALTLGSRPERRAARAAELTEACRILGFRNDYLEMACEAPDRLKSFRPEKGTGPGGLVGAVLAILVHHRPALVVYPHRRDGHPAHEGAGRLLEQALRLYSKGGKSVAAVETECWHPLPRVNLVVEGTDAQVGRLCTAIGCHAGEIIRNPYHVRQPIRMLENGFRVSETAGGFGSPATPVAYCELYGLFRYRNGRKRRSRLRHFLRRSCCLCLDRLLADAF